MAAGDRLRRRHARATTHAQAALEAAGGYAWRSRLESILRGLGFADEDARPAARVVLGRRADARLAGPRAGRATRTCCCSTSPRTTSTCARWSGSRTSSRRLDCAVLLVSHDRWFLERVATGVLELERGRAQALRHALQRLPPREGRGAGRTRPSAFERQQEEIARLQRFVDKFRAGTRSRQAAVEGRRSSTAWSASRRRAASGRSPSASPRSSAPARIVIEAESLDARVGERPLLRRRELRRRARPARGADRPERRRQDDAGRDAARLRPPVAGRVKLGHNVEPGYFSQHIDEMREQLTRDRGDVAGRHAGAAHLDAGAHDPRPLPVHPGRGRAPRRGAVGRRAAAARAGRAGRLRRQPARARRAHEPPRRREPRGARGGARRLRRHHPAGLARPRADRRRRDAHREPSRTGASSLRHGDYNDYLAATRPAAPAPAARAAPVQKRRGAGAAEAGRAAAPDPARAAERRAGDRGARGGAAPPRGDLADPDVLGDPDRLAATGTRHRELQEELAWKLRRWEDLQEGRVPGESSRFRSAAPGYNRPRYGHHRSHPGTRPAPLRGLDARSSAPRSSSPSRRSRTA